MLHALLKRKLRVIESTLDYRDVEDHLTASVLARISYLSQKSASRLIEESIVEQRYGNSDAPRSGAGLDEVWVDFWPRYADPTSSQNIVEPDAILKIGNRIYVVEAKRSDSWGQLHDQAARDWLSYYLDNDEDEGLEGDEGTLLLLGGVADNDHFASLANEVHHIIAGNKQASMPRIAWASWTKMASKVRDFIHHAEPQDARILEDINLSLTYHGFGAWMSYSELTVAVGKRAIDLRADPLPTTWPVAPIEAAPSSSASLASPLIDPIDSWRRSAPSVVIDENPSRFRFFPNGK